MKSRSTRRAWLAEMLGGLLGMFVAGGSGSKAGPPAGNHLPDVDPFMLATGVRISSRGVAVGIVNTTVRTKPGPDGATVFHIIPVSDTAGFLDQTFTCMLPAGLLLG